VTFLSTDMKGSTRRETEPGSMRAAPADHDDMLRSAAEAHGGWLFKHTGDGSARRSQRRERSRRLDRHPRASCNYRAETSSNGPICAAMTLVRY
jgi:class 3 adenylate cyclase